jgi:hypothetical protein
MNMVAKIIASAFFLMVFASASLAQSLGGISIGDPPAVLERVNLETIARAGTGAMKTVKYKLANGNELSVTYNSRANRILYVESDWNITPDAAATDFPGFKFGNTTLEDIRRVTGSNGFSYQSNAMSKAEGKIRAFNCYEVRNKPGLISCFITVLNVADLRNRIGSREVRVEDVSKSAKLEAIILADEEYLDSIWGEEKTYDKDIKPISW